jgi:hypothetical protein
VGTGDRFKVPSLLGVAYRFMLRRQPEGATAVSVPS